MNVNGLWIEHNMQVYYADLWCNENVTRDNPSTCARAYDMFAIRFNLVLPPLLGH
jgi:hypothetical protein